MEERSLNAVKRESRHEKSPRDANFPRDSSGWVRKRHVPDVEAITYRSHPSYYGMFESPRFCRYRVQHRQSDGEIENGKRGVPKDSVRLQLDHRDKQDEDPYGGQPFFSKEIHVTRERGFVKRQETADGDRIEPGRKRSFCQPLISQLREGKSR